MHCIVYIVQYKADWERRLKSAETVSVEMLLLTCFLLCYVTVCEVTCVYCTVGAHLMVMIVC